MDSSAMNKGKLSVGLWLLTFVCAVIIVSSLAFGAAFGAIQNARVTAAKANLGLIENVFIMAEMSAEKAGFSVTTNVLTNMLRSYDTAKGESLSPYEKYLLDKMLETFGNNRDFDFAVTRFKDGSGEHLQVYYFPIKGRTNIQSDRYYMMLDGEIR